MKNEKKNNKSVATVLPLLQEGGIDVPAGFFDRWEEHLALVRKWNAYASLVSLQDAERLEERHLTDSLSLAPLVQGVAGAGGTWLDIGSGGGFPAIPIKILLPDVPLVLIERTGKKVSFLRKAIGVLHLRDIQLIQGEFPMVARDVCPAVITARAVERPKKIIESIAGFMVPGSAFLCQSGDPRADLPATFHVEQHVDAWSCSGLRRGELYIVRRKE